MFKTGVEMYDAALAQISALEAVIEKRFDIKDPDMDPAEIAQDPEFYEDFLCTRISCYATKLEVAGVPARLCRQYRRFAEMAVEFACDLVKNPSDQDYLLSCLDKWLDKNLDEVIKMLTKIASC